MNKTGIKTNPLFEKTTVKHSDVITEKQGSVKCTYSISAETVKLIEKTKYDLITKYDKKVSRSKLVEIAIKFINDDLEANQDKCIILDNLSTTP